MCSARVAVIRPRPADVESTAGAQVVFENGDDLDHWMGKVVSQAGGDPKVVDLGAAAPVELPGESSGADASRVDPHWWHDPVNAEAAVRKIRDVLVTEDPKAKAGFERRARAYIAALQRLRQRTQSCFAAVPRAERKLVTDHDAFAYFARRYGISYAQLAVLLRERGISAALAQNGETESSGGHGTS